MPTIPKCTLVPTRFFDAGDARAALEQVASLKAEDRVGFAALPQFDAVLVYSTPDGSIPQLFDVLSKVGLCSEYNKILASWQDGCLSLAIAQGNTLLLSNTFPAGDFTTAQYFIFAAVKSLQLNPEMSSICFLTPLDESEEMSLYRYFRSVEHIRTA